MYRVFGFTLASELAFPHLLGEPGVRGNSPDLVLRLRRTGVHNAPEFRSRSLLLWEDRESDRPSLSVHQVAGGTLFRYHHRAVFAIDPGLRTVTCFTDPGVDEELIRFLFLTLVASFILQRRGRPALHAAAVKCGEEAIAFLAPSGGGKSSLTAYCVRAGHSLLTDDLLPVQLGREGLLALPGPPALRLWPDSAAALCGGSASLPRQRGQGKKRQVSLPLSKRYYFDEPLRLRALYFLERSADGSVGLKRVSQRDAVVALVGSVYGNFLSSRACLLRQLAIFSAAVPTLACRRLRVPPDFRALPAIHDAILGDLAALKQERPGRASPTAYG